MKNYKEQELLKVLDMDKDKQWNFLISLRIIQEMCQHQLDAYCQKKFKRRVLADLAFRLRNKALEYQGWLTALDDVWKHFCNQNNKNLTLDDFWIHVAQPIHWIIAALITIEGLHQKSDKVRDLKYAIGQDYGGSYGMWDGPNPSLEEMLRVDGRDKDSVIIRFNENGSDEVLYRWLTDPDQVGDYSWWEVERGKDG